MESSDAIALGSAVVSSVSLVVALVAARQARRSADAAERQARAAEKSIPPEPAAVSWKIEDHGGGQFVLRHTGTVMAHNVRIELPPDSTARVQADLRDGTVLPDGGVDFRLTLAWTDRRLNALPVVWDGRITPVQVPFPPAGKGKRPVRLLN